MRLEVLESRLVCSVFGSPLVVPTGREVRGLIQGDLNGDGRADLVVANRSSNSVAVLVSASSPASATPAYTERRDYRTGRNPTFVNLADLNDDGRLDLVVSNGGSNNLAFYLNATPSGALVPEFLARQDVDLDHNATALVDLNGDGVADVAAVNRERGLLTVWTNNTPAGGSKVTLADQNTRRVGYGCRFIAGGDLDNDGDNDLVVSSESTSQVAVLWNQTRPAAHRINLSPGPLLAVGGQPRDLALGDLDGDGLLDIAVARQQAGALRFFYGSQEQGVHKFVPGRVRLGAAQRGIAAGDLNGDGKAEVVVTLRNQDRAALIADGAPIEFFLTGRFPVFAHLGDLNGDDRLDLAIGCRDDGTAEVRLNNL